MRAGVVDVLNVLMAGDATGGCQRAGMRIVLDSGQINVAIHAGDPSLAVLAGVEFPDVNEQAPAGIIFQTGIAVTFEAVARFLRGPGPSRQAASEQGDRTESDPNHPTEPFDSHGCT